jgi:hypothetical protein
VAAGPSSTTTTIAWSIQTLAVGNLSFPSARLSFQLYGRTTLPARRVTSVDCWLDTGAPLTVIPFHVHNQRLLWQSLPGLTTTWMGQRCDLGRVDVWLPTQQPPNVRGPLPLLAKFARTDPPGSLVPVLLGLEFFLTHRAELTLLLPPQYSVIRLP